MGQLFVFVYAVCVCVCVAKSWGHFDYQEMKVILKIVNASLADTSYA